MSTNSGIFYQREDGKFEGVLAHYDGYLSGVGLTLYQYYKDIEKIKALVSLGMLRSVSANLTPPKYRKTSTYDSRLISIPGYTSSYHHDRGDSLDILTFSSLDEILNSSYMEYIYIWKDNQWFVHFYKNYFPDETGYFEPEGEKEWRPLKEVLDIRLKKQGYEENPQQHEIKFNTVEEFQNIVNKRLIISTKNNYKLNEYIKLQTDVINPDTKEKEHYELLLSVKEITQPEEIHDNYQMIWLSYPPSEVCWFYPVKPS